MTKARAYIALLALAVICLGALCTASYQSITSVYMPVRCFSEYSTDGEHFFPLEAEQRFNARDGGLTLRMKLPESYAFPFRMHMPLDHITASVAVNGQIVRETGLPDGGTDSTHCGSTWLHLDEEQLSPGGELTVTLHNPHPFGANADAYNTFLDHVYVADEACLSAQLSRRYALMHWLGAVELAAVPVCHGRIVGREHGLHADQCLHHHPVSRPPDGRGEPDGHQPEEHIHHKRNADEPDVHDARRADAVR